MAHPTLSGAPGQAAANQPLLGFCWTCSTIIHRTIRCATGLSGEPAEQWLPVRQRSTAQRNSAEQCRDRVRAQKSEVTGLSGVEPDCPVQQKDKRLQRLTAPNPNGRVDVVHTGQLIVNIRCATELSSAPIDSSLPTATLVVEGYKYSPITTTSSIQDF